jgi:hypothetical protein
MTSENDYDELDFLGYRFDVYIIYVRDVGPIPARSLIPTINITNGGMK